MSRYYCIILILFFGNLKATTKDSLFRSHAVWVGSSKISYFLSRSPGANWGYDSYIHNAQPSFAIGYEYFYPIGKTLVLNTGVNYTTSKFKLVCTDFIAPSVMEATIIKSIRADRLSVPIGINYRVKISNETYFLFGAAVESFLTTVFKPYTKDNIQVWNTSGQLDKNRSVVSHYGNEGLSWFRTVNFSGKLFLNNRSKNRLYLGVNYYLMSNYFPMEIKTNMFIGQKNFSATNNPKFDGLRFSAGYTW